MCHRVVCPDCGKFTWEGCGLHIAQALAGLSLEQICACDDDKDSEHSWATILNPTSPSRPVPRYPLPYPAASSSSLTSNIPSSLPIPSSSSFSITSPNPASIPTCHDSSTSSSSSTTTTPDPIQYKLSKISTTSATTAALRMAAQAEALEELKRIKQQKEQELKEANQGALQKLLQGLSEADDDNQGGAPTGS
ncbi:hypothetical protein BGZ81_000375 [Podila clonocystis]|nr:hypothetical protein BGZ81_000375 [Podila clonocystis]